MKSFLEKLVFRGKKPKQFVPVRIFDDAVEERAIIETKRGEIIDITRRHSIVSQTAFCVAVFFDKEDSCLLNDNRLPMQIVKDQKLISSFHLKKVHSINYQDSFIILYEIVQVHNYQLNIIQRELALRFSFKNKSTSYFERKIYAGLYSFPRKVIIVSYAEEDYNNIFPMDFQCYIPIANICLLGLRTSNITLDKIIKSKRLVISDTSYADIDIIYSLGHHHVQALDINELAFKVSLSELYKFPVPDFAAGYKELELVDFYKAGSHMLLIAKVINYNEVKKESSSLYHVHYFQSINSRYTLP